MLNHCSTLRVRPARVLLLMPEIGPRRGGGIHRVGCGLMRLLDAKQRAGAVQARVLSLGTPDDDAQARELHDTWGDRLAWYGNRRLRFSIAALAAMARWADAAVFTHVGPASLLPLLPRPFRPASLAFIHGIEVWRPLKTRHRLALRSTDRVVSNSEFTARKARGVNPWLNGVLHCPLGIQEGAAADPAGIDRVLGFCPSRHDILIVARMIKGQCRKGHRELIAAMGQVVAAVPDARLIIAGTGDNVESYREMARRSPAADRIVFVGFVGDDVLRGLYHRIGVFAMPSRQEGFGLVYAEAMAAGLPCVASNCDASGEVVVDGETGIVVDPGDTGSLADALIRILTDETLRRRLGENGRKRFEEHFTEQRFHQRVWDLLTNTLNDVDGRER